MFSIKVIVQLKIGLFSDALEVKIIRKSLNKSLRHFFNQKESKVSIFACSSNNQTVQEIPITLKNRKKEQRTSQKNVQNEREANERKINKKKETHQILQWSGFFLCVAEQNSCLFQFYCSLNSKSLWFDLKVCIGCVMDSCVQCANEIPMQEWTLWNLCECSRFNLY